MDLITSAGAAKLWNISQRRITGLCNEGRINGAFKLGNNWVIPAKTPKPSDERIKSGKYIENNHNYTEYILKHFDTILLEFTLTREFDGPYVKINKVNEKKIHLLPLNLKLNDEGLLKWLKNRAVPSNRAYVENFLAKMEINQKDLKGIIDICKGLSLTDSYWTPNKHFTGTFEEVNLFSNRFSNVLSAIAFTGYGSFDKKGFTSSPEFTTNGMFAKGWRRMGGKVFLYKGGTEGFGNTGKEPYSEYYASQIAKTMELEYIPYGLSMWKGKLCSTCQLFTSDDTAFVPIGSLVKGGIKEVLNYCKNLGEKYYDKLVDMLVFDAVICNTDRHFGNIGVLIDSKTNEIKDLAPIFDNGLSLFCYGMEDEFENLEKYAKTRTPASYPDFMAFTKDIITKRQKEKLRKLLNFKFKKHTRYNMPQERLKTIEEFIKARAGKLLK